MTESAYARSKRDQRVAEEVTSDNWMMCAATGCPNRWSVDAGRGRLCSAHAWVPSTRWPSVTQEQLDAEMQRALDVQNPPAPRAPVNRQQVVQALHDLRVALLSPKDPTLWARRLHEREQRGELLTEFQRECWRRVFRPADDAPDAAPIYPIPVDALPPAMRPEARHGAR